MRFDELRLPIHQVERVVVVDVMVGVGLWFYLPHELRHFVLAEEVVAAGRDAQLPLQDAVEFVVVHAAKHQQLHISSGTSGSLCLMVCSTNSVDSRVLVVHAAMVFSLP